MNLMRCRIVFYFAMKYAEISLLCKKTNTMLRNTQTQTFQDYVSPEVLTIEVNEKSSILTLSDGEGEGGDVGDGGDY